MPLAGPESIAAGPRAATSPWTWAIMPAGMPGRRGRSGAKRAGCVSTTRPPRRAPAVAAAVAARPTRQSRRAIQPRSASGTTKSTVASAKPQAKAAGSAQRRSRIVTPPQAIPGHKRILIFLLPLGVKKAYPSSLVQQRRPYGLAHRRAAQLPRLQVPRALHDVVPRERARCAHEAPRVVGGHAVVRGAAEVEHAVGLGLQSMRLRGEPARALGRQRA